MDKPLICLTLAKKTLDEDICLVNEYRKYIDMVELRADYLDEDELLSIRRFPEIAQIPTILTIRRCIDGGLYRGGEGSRTMLFARALAFANQDERKNFAYVDFEDDFYIPSLQDAALAFGTRIIRSMHDMENPVKNLAKHFSQMCKTAYEIPKIACMPHSLSDVTEIFKECETLTDQPHIICAMGSMGFPTRVLSEKLHSYLTFVSPPDSEALNTIGHIDPIAMHDIYHFNLIDENTKIFGVAGWPLKKTSSPELHNEGYKRGEINAVYIPIVSPNIHEVLDFAKQIGIQGLSVTVPHKENVLPLLSKLSTGVQKIGACNTIVRQNDGTWAGYNTDSIGIEQALLDFIKVKNLKHRKVAIIGAGGAAKAVAYTVKQLGGKACIFNRTLAKAKIIAEKYGFDYAPLSPDGDDKLTKYSSLIIQTTSKGMGETSVSTESNDPIWFHEFSCTESLFDIVYVPAITPVMARAKAAGCKVCNGMSMLSYQGFEQFKLFTGKEYIRENSGEKNDAK